VAEPPTARIESPAGGGSYVVGQKVATRFSCQEGSYGPGLEACEDSNGLKTEKGGEGLLDTATVGPHTYTVKARSKDGQSGETSIAYTVVGPQGGAPHAISVGAVEIPRRRVTVKRHRAQLALVCKYGKGAGSCTGTVSLTLRRRVVRTVRGRRRARVRTVVIARTHYSIAAGAGKVVALKLPKPVLHLLVRGRRPLKARATATVVGGKGASRVVALVERRAKAGRKRHKRSLRRR